ncbi:copper chaperone PCu(A)C [Falsihalocynthiibacter sp. SS001]|uniref:copper chaperone PCu(A)C n=1 Tax=Falsihalocynthiibacter sp. SS001 TaxID=3349698 RepID=UPI0036D30712
MSFVTSLRAPLVASLIATLAVPAFADIEIHDAYARSATKVAKTGAAFFHIMNTGEADRLVGVSSDAAPRVELHTHKDMGDGVMKMMHVEEGFSIPADGMHALERGGDHVMFMGLPKGFEDGETVSITLHFEKAGDVAVDIPVDNERADDMAHGDKKHGHGEMDHGDKDHSNH